MKKLISMVMIFVLAAGLSLRTEASAESDANAVEDSVATLYVACYVDGEVYDVRAGTGIYVGLPGTAGKYILTSKYVTDGYSDWPENSEKGFFTQIGEDVSYIDSRNIKVLSEEYNLTLITLPEPIEPFRSVTMGAETQLQEGEAIDIVGYDGESTTRVNGQIRNLYSSDGSFVDMFDANAEPTSGQWGGLVVTEEGNPAGICIGAYNDKEDNGNPISLVVSGDCIDQILQDAGVYDADKTVDDSGYLLGAWGDAVSTRASAITEQPAFYTNHQITNCTSITVEFEITEYTGYPFDLWYLDLRKPDGNWIHAGSFKVDESTVGHMKEFVVSFDEPVSFDAVTVVSSSKWNSYSLSSIVNYKDIQTD